MSTADGEGFAIDPTQVRAWKRYPAYKDSGVELLGEVPAGWEVKRLKYLCQINPSKSEVASLPKSTKVSFLPMELIGEDCSLTLTENRPISDVWEGYTYFRNGDVIVAKITPCFENGKGALCDNLVNGIAFGTTELHVLRAGEKIDPRFLFLATKSYQFRRLGADLMTGTAGQKRVPDAFIRDYIVALPPLPEQRAIAAFLDRETARLDTLIAKKQRFIELLEEKRQALISHAVTKGLDPNVEMKDSGMEWLGEVPEGWEVVTLRRVCRVQQGLQIPQAERFYEPGLDRLEYITVKSIHNRNGDEVKEYIQSPPERVICYPEDILFARTGATGEIITGYAGAFHNNFFKVIYDKKRTIKDFLVYYLQNNLIKQHFCLMAGTTTIPDLNHDEFLDSPFVSPPLSEQTAIINYINSMLNLLAQQKENINRSVASLNEYRTALISAAVTGKIDVRNEEAA